MMSYSCYRGVHRYKHMARRNFYSDPNRITPIQNYATVRLNLQGRAFYFYLCMPYFALAGTTSQAPSTETGSKIPTEPRILS